MKKKKVLIVGLTAGVGGVETFICNIAKNINTSKFDIEFLMHEDLNDKYKEELNCFKIHKVRGIKSNPILFIREIFKFYKNHKFDIIHLNECDATMFLYTIPLLFDKKTKFIVHSHSSSTKNQFIHNLLKYFQNKRANIKWACSDIAFEYMYGKKESKVIIHNGIDLNKFKFNKETREKKRNELKLTDEIVFCSIARFTKEKNHEKIVDIFYEFNRIDTNSKLVLVGTGPLQENIKYKVKKLNISNKVLFLNSRSDVNELLSAVDIFLLPSTFEGLPFVSLEGQACAVSFFASTNVSKEIAVTDLVHFIDLKENSKSWAKKIKNTLNNKIERESEKYPQKIREAGFDIDEVCKIIEKSYKE